MHMLVDKRLFSDKKVNEMFLTDFVEASTACAMSEFDNEAAAAAAVNGPGPPTKANSDPKDDKIIYHKIDNCVPYLIQWTRVPKEVYEGYRVYRVYIPYPITHIPFTIHHTPYTIHHTPYTIHHTP